MSHLMMAPSPAIHPPSLQSPLPSASGDGEVELVWYGNIQYLLNISCIGALSCLFIFLFVKLRSDHHRMPGPSALIVKLLAVWHATGHEIARHCGADAAQFLIIEGGSCAILIGIAFFSVAFLLPLNLYGGNVTMNDQFSTTTINHIEKGSPLLWIHLFFVFIVVILVHFGISSIEERLRVTRFRDGYGNLSSSTAGWTAIFTVMVNGVPRSLGFDKTPLQEYFQYKYPGKVHRVIVPIDLCAIDNLVSELVRVRDEISWLVARIDSYSHEDGPDCDSRQGASEEFTARVRNLSARAKNLWRWLQYNLGFTEQERLRKLQELRAELEMELAAYKEGCAPGAGVAFVIFRDVYTANKAVNDFLTEKRKRIGRFFSVMELQLERNQWKVERAPLATDIYWSNLGTRKFSLKLRRVCTNACLLLMLLFFTSPLAIITAVKSAGRIIDAEAMDSAEVWVGWLQSSSWIAALIFQFLPNVIIFVSMYIVIPSALSYLSKFERHLTVSREQKAVLLKMVCFFLVNLIVLRGLVESSLESWILRMGRCYLDGEDCRKIEQYLSASFLSKSCLSSLAFLITSTFLGISYDLLAPVPWIKKNLQKLQKNDMLQLVPEQSEEYQLEGQESNNSLQRPLMSETSVDMQGQDLSVYPINATSPIPKQRFDFAQYYAFNLTILALTMIYSCFAPVMVPVGAIYFGYRYVVDKYNFLFVYRVQGFPAGNDGRLMDIVLCIMRFCLDMFLLLMLLFFSVRGDSKKLQAIFVLGLLILYKLLPASSDVFQPATLEAVQTISSYLDGSIDYEVFSQPRFEFDTYTL